MPSEVTDDCDNCDDITLGLYYRGSTGEIRVIRVSAETCDVAGHR